MEKYDMRWVWFVLWLSFVSLTSVPIVLQYFIKEPSVPEVHKVETNLLELARQTNVYWRDVLNEDRKFDHMMAGGAFDTDISVTDSIVQLSELMDILGSRGVEAQLAEDLEDWFLLECDDVTPERKQSYLSGIVEWLSPYLSEKYQPVLSKVRLDPGSISSFPELHFEMYGDPETMGRLLLSTSGTKGVWRLKQMELLYRNSSEAWWLQGNCSFDP